MILEAVHRSPDICLTAEENSRKPQLGERLIKGLCLQWGPFPPIEVGRIAQHARKGERRTWGKDGIGKEKSKVPIITSTFHFFLIFSVLILSLNVTPLKERKNLICELFILNDSTRSLHYNTSSWSEAWVGLLIIIAFLICAKEKQIGRRRVRHSHLVTLK